MFDASYIIQQDVLIHSGKASKGAVSLIRTLEEEEMPYVIVCEQTGRIRDHIADYFVERDFRYVRPSCIYTSAMAAVDYLLLKEKNMNKAAYIGGAGIKEALEKGGFQISFDHPDVVLVGMNKKCTYEDYSKILVCLNDGAKLVSTDNRKTQKTDGMQMIGNASIVKMLEYASDQEAISFGRGSLNDLLMCKRFLKKDNILVVGNDFTRDIIPAMKLGMSTVFVTEGRSIMHLGMNEDMHPDYIVEDLFGLTK